MRLDVALVYTDGRKEVVTVGRPADLIAFADQFDKLAPDGPHAIREITWLTHRTLRSSVPLEQWIESLEDITADRDAVAEMRQELGAPDPTDAAAAEPTPIVRGAELVEELRMSSGSGSRASA